MTGLNSFQTKLNDYIQGIQNYRPFGGEEEEGGELETVEPNLSGRNTIIQIDQTKMNAAIYLDEYRIRRILYEDNGGEIKNI